MTQLTAARPDRRALIFIMLTVLLDTMGFGLIVPVLPTLISDLGDVPVEQAATIGGALVMTYALAQFFCAPVLGALSDAHGRRPVLLGSMAGFAISALIGAWAPVLWLLFVGRIIAGACGASYSTAYAFIADVTPPERRAETFGLIGVAFGLGFVIGPALGGLLGAEHVRAPFLAAASLAGINMLLGLFVLPESLPKDRRRPFSWARANPVAALARLGRLEGPLRRLAVAYFIWMLAVQSLHGVWAFIAAYRYDWTPRGVGLSLALVGALAVLVNGFLVKRAVDRLGEWRTALAGMLGGAIGYTVQVFAGTPELAYVALTIGALGGLTVPALQAMMTERASPRAQGELQGALATLSSISVVIGPPLFASIFTTWSAADAPLHAPGAPFLLSAMLALGACLMLAGVRQAPSTDAQASA